MEKIRKIPIAPGLYWVEIPAAGLIIQCGCVEDSVKHLIRRGLIDSKEHDGVIRETGPNAVLLSDLMLQNGAFANLAEFPVLQMLYRQGMGILQNPGNTGRKPLLIGSPGQIRAQMEYIRRGNYGLVSKEELSAAGIDESTADLIWNVKMDFASGNIKSSEELYESISIQDDPVEIRNGVFIERMELNRFSISYRGESVSVDLNIPIGRRYPAPYPLGFHDIGREYFGVVHSGQGDGWDINRPCMSSILIYQGKIYVIDTGPNILYSLIALGIGINEVEGVFHTHCHDDHFAGLPALLLGDHRIKYYAAPFVRASVFKKLSALVSLPEKDFSTFFDIHDLTEGVWNDIDGLEVKPVMSPHPVETTTLSFRTLWEGRYYSYAHLADITSSDQTERDESELRRVPADYYRRVIEDYREPYDLKKIDIGSNAVHGKASDFEDDRSERIILAHTATPLTNRQKEIGSSAPFGMADVLIKAQADPLIEKAGLYLSDYLAGVSEHDLKPLLNNDIARFNPGTIIIRRNEPHAFAYLLLTGSVEMINSRNGTYNVFSPGALVGERYGEDMQSSDATYRTISFVHALKIPLETFQHFVEQRDLLPEMKRLWRRKHLLVQSWLFGESLSPRVRACLAEQLVPIELPESGSKLGKLDEGSIYLIEQGCLAFRRDGVIVEELAAGDFFGEDRSVFDQDYDEDYGLELIIREPVRGFGLPTHHIDDIPVVRWKLLETYCRRTEAGRFNS